MTYSSDGLEKLRELTEKLPPLPPVASVKPEIDITYIDFESTARGIFDLARTMTGAKSGYIALLSDDGSENEVLFLEAGGLPCTVDESLPMPIRGLRAESYKSGRAACDNDFMNSKWMKWMPEGHVDLKNVMFAPLNIGNKTVGLMGLANKDGDFTEHDQKIAEGFGHLAAIALSHSRTLEELKRSVEEGS